MKKLQDQLKEVSKALAKLSKQVEKISTQVNKNKLDASKSKPGGKAAKAQKKPASKSAPAKKAVKKTPAASKEPTVLDMVFNVIKRSRSGVTIATLKEKTNLKPRQLSNALYKLSRRGKIQAKSRGHYIKV